MGIAGLILGFRPASERHCNKVMLSLIGWGKSRISPASKSAYGGSYDDAIT